jgi:hypothetical protein
VFQDCLNGQTTRSKNMSCESLAMKQDTLIKELQNKDSTIKFNQYRSSTGRYVEPATSRVNRKVGCLNIVLKQQAIFKKNHFVKIRVIESRVAFRNSWALGSVFTDHTNLFLTLKKESSIQGLGLLQLNH